MMLLPYDDCPECSGTYTYRLKDGTSRVCQKCTVKRSWEICLHGLMDAPNLKTTPLLEEISYPVLIIEYDHILTLNAHLKAFFKGQRRDGLPIWIDWKRLDSYNLIGASIGASVDGEDSIFRSNPLLLIDTGRPGAFPYFERAHQRHTMVVSTRHGLPGNLKTWVAVQGKLENFLTKCGEFSETLRGMRRITLSRPNTHGLVPQSSVSKNLKKGRGLGGVDDSLLNPNTELEARIREFREGAV